jgi:hypothetical protein
VRNTQGIVLYLLAEASRGSLVNLDFAVWPYIGTGLVVVLEWYALATLFVGMVWVLFVYDLRLLHARMREAGGPAGQELLTRLLREQMVNVRIAMPLIDTTSSCSAHR